MKKLVCVTICLVWISTIANLNAQVSTCGLNGIVTDPSNSVIVGAAVKAVNSAQGVERATVTGSGGFYNLSDLPTGSYRVRIEAKGFSASEFNMVELEAGAKKTLDAQLKIEGGSTTVETSTNTTTIDLTQSMIQDHVTSENIASLPLNGRNFSRTCISDPRQPSRANL